ncbi:MAG: hypothetical protein AB8B55_10220 [Mariniblastus sp.]
MNVVLFFLAVVFAIAGLQDSEKQTPDPYRKMNFRVIRWEDGEPKLITLQMSKVNICEFESMLNEIEIRKELELSPEQESKLDVLLKRVLLEGNQFQAKWADSRGIPNPSDLPELEQIRSEVEAELDDILLPFQAERIDEIRLRLAIRETGVLFFLKLHRDKFSFSNAEESELNAAANSLTEEIQSEGSELVSQSITNLLAPLTASQRKIVADQIEQDSEIFDLDIYLAQLNYLQKYPSFEIGESTDKRFDNMVEFAPNFAITFDGRFRALKPGMDPTLIPTTVDRIIALPERPLGESDAQKLAFGAAKKKYWDRVRELQSERVDQRVANGLVTEKQNDAFNAAMESAAEELNNRYDSVLDSYQKKIIRRTQAKTMLPRFGLVANLLRGDLKKKARITDKQQKEIEKICESEIERLNDLLLGWDEEMMSLVKKKMSSESRQKFSKSVGERLKHVVPTFRMLVKASRSN